MAAPTIIFQPTGMSVPLGETGVFSGGVTGSTPLWLNWYDLIGGATGVIGETGSALYIPDVQVDDVGEYWFVAENSEGTVESDHVNLSTYISVSYTYGSGINVLQRAIRKSDHLSCVGWVMEPAFAADGILLPLAVSDKDGGVTDAPKSIQFQLIKELNDYRLSFFNSKSKLVNKTTKVNISDKKWHFLAYLCNAEGAMSYMVDGIVLPAEGGAGPEGMPYNIAWTQEPRTGGGDVWCPYLDQAGQALSVYNWRMVKGITLTEDTVRVLFERDKRSLEIT